MKKNDVHVGDQVTQTQKGVLMEKTTYKSVAAQQAQEANYGSPTYWDYLDKHAEELAARGVADAFTQTLSEALKGNDGE